MKTKHEIEEFYRRRMEIEDYHATRNQIVPVSTANNPKRKQALVDMIRTGRPNDTTAMTESNDITIVGDVPSTGEQPAVDRWLHDEM